MADVANTFAAWSSTSNSNSPSGATNISTGLDDNLRELQGVVVRGLSHKGSDLASSTAPALGATEGVMHDITGTATITGFDTVRAGIWKLIKFEGALTLTHNATNLILPGAANITTADGDVGLFFSEGSGNWRCHAYTRANGAPIASFVDSSAIVRGSSDATKLVRIEADGITTATTRVITMPDSDIPLAGSSLVLLQRTIASSAATVDFTTVISSTYGSYLLLLEKVIPQTDTADLWVRASIDGGSTYLTTNAYNWSRHSVVSDGTTLGSGPSGTTDQIQVDNSLGTNTGEVLNAALTFQNLADTVVYKTMHGTACSYDSSTQFANLTCAGVILTTSAVNGIRVMMSTGNINGTFVLYGYRKA